ncbi:MAG: PAS domain S-box protein [Verrucomicrobiota bacterium]
MKKGTKISATTFRQKAEAKLKTRTDNARLVSEKTSEPNIQKLIHELEVHQIELELQNEELLMAMKQRELTAEKYTNLYDFAPSGYFTLSADGKIMEVNHAGVRMLGKERLYFQKALFIYFVSGDSRPAFNRFLAEAIKSTHSVTCEVTLIAEGNIPLDVKLLGIRDKSGKHCLVTAIDITERKITELRLQKDTERNDLLLELFAQAPVLADKELYDRALDIAVKLTDSKIGFFHQVSDNQQEIILTTWNDEARKNCTTISDNHYPLKAAGNWADCVRQKQAVVYNNFQQSPNKKGLPEGHAPVGRFMSIPVVQNDKVRLIFGVGNKATDYTDSDVVQIQSVAGELYKILEKRKIEQSLRKIEDRWQFALEGSNDGVWDWNVLTGEVFFSNRWKEMIGYGPEELEGKLSEWKERVHADDLPEVLETLQRHFNGESPQYVSEHRIRCKDGSWKWITGRGKVLERTPEGKPARMLGTHIDITERKIAEETIRKSEEKYRKLVDNLPFILYRLILKPELRFDYVSPSVTEITGYTPEEHYADPQLGFKLVHPDDRKFLNDTATHSQGEPLVLRWIKKDGTVIWTEQRNVLFFDENNEPFAIEGQARDITESKIAAETIRKSEEKFRIVADNAFNWEFWEGADGQWIHHSLSCKKLTGYSADEFMNDNELLLKIIHPDDLQVYLLHQQKARENLTPGSLYFRIITKDGEIRDIEHVCQPVYNDAGLYIGIRGSNIDITERRQAEMKVILSEDKYRQLYEFNQMPIAIFEVNTLNFLSVNNAWVDKYGYTKEELLSMTILDIRPESEIEKVKQLVRQTSKGLENIGEYLHENKNGEILQVEIIRYDLIFEGKNAKLVFANDITERKKAEEALRESEVQYRNLANSGSALIWTSGTDKLCNYFNEPWQKFTGRTLEQELGNGWGNGVHQEDFDRCLETYFSAFDKREPFEMEYRLCHVSGEYRWIMDLGTPNFNNKGVFVGYIGHCFDISERKLVEDTQSFLLGCGLPGSSGDFFESLAHYLAITLDMEYVCIDRLIGDGLTAQTVAIYNEGRFESNVQYALKDTPCGEVVDKSVCCYRSGVRHLFPNDPALQDLTAESYIGTTLIDSKGQAIGLIAIIGHQPFHSRTKAESLLKLVAPRAAGELERIEAENALKETLNKLLEAKAQAEERENQFQKVVENFPDGIIVIYDTDFRYVLVEGLGLKDIGLSKEMLLNKKSGDIFPAEFCTKLELHIYDALQGKKSTFEINLGDEYFMETVMPFKIENGKITQVLGVIEIITLNKRTEKELRLAKERAEESDRLKSAFLANMSHEIRTPMNGILGFSELLKKPDLTGVEQQKYIRIIEKSGARMLNIINDIVDISKIEAGLMKLEMMESNINEQIEYIYTFFKPEVEAKGMKLSFYNSLPAKEATITTDREKLYAILTNLVKNAIKYTEEGKIELVYTRKGQCLEFYVKDNGIGIPKDRQEAIFERFVQAEIEDRKARQGAGLGLAITKSYVEMCGGRIWVESEEGIGSTFYFTIPYIAETKGKNILQEILPPEKANKEVSNLKILIAEDDEVSALLLEIEFQTYCKEIIKVRTGVEAVEICRTHPDIDLILMDIQMPEMGGYEATRKIRQFNQDAVIISQTAFAQIGDRERSIQAGCNDYIAKPIKKAELHALIQVYFRK